VGAEVRQLGRGDVELKIGSLFSGDERRIVLELEADAPTDVMSIDTNVSWNQVGGGMANLDLERLRIGITDDHDAVLASRDNAVWSSGVSALASIRQMEAAEAYRKGDIGRANKLIEQNAVELEDAAAAAPAPMAKSLRKQKSSYDATGERFRRTAPSSAEGRAAAKESAEADAMNLDRQAY
jgi:Ca-activated chloride channel family protein